MQSNALFHIAMNFLLRPYIFLSLMAVAYELSGQSLPFAGAMPPSTYYHHLVDTIVRQGFRNAGSPADTWVENYGMSIFRSYGLQQVTTQNIPIQSWQVNLAELRITTPSGIKTFPLFPQLFVDWTDVVEAPAIRFDSTTALPEARDKIVIVDFPLDRFAPAAFQPNVTYTYDPDNSIASTIHPQPIPHRANQSGALIGRILAQRPKAVICVLSNFFDTHRVWGLYSRTDSIYDIPCFWMGRKSAEAVDLLVDDDNLFSIAFSAQDRSAVTRNVYAILPGNSSQYIVFNSHHDGQFYGATEDAAGIALVAAQARYWSQVPEEKRPFSMVFLWDAAHLKQSVGSEFFVKNTPEIINNTLLCFTLETPSREGRVINGKLLTLDRPEPRWFYTSDTLGLRESLLAAVQQEDLRRTFVAPPTLNGSSPIGDSHAFYEAGIPIVAHLSTPVWYMADADSTDKIDTVSMNRITRSVIRMIWNLPTITGIPSFEESRYTLSPNPTSGPVTISGIQPGQQLGFRVINLAGHTLCEGDARHAADVGLDLSRLSPGLYLMMLIDKLNGQPLAVNRLIRK